MNLVIENTTASYQTLAKQTSQITNEFGSRNKGSNNQEEVDNNEIPQASPNVQQHVQVPHIDP